MTPPEAPAVWFSPRIDPVHPAALNASRYRQMPGEGAAVVVISHVSSDPAPGVVATPVVVPVSMSPGAMAAMGVAAAFDSFGSTSGYVVCAKLVAEAATPTIIPASTRIPGVRALRG